MCFCEYLFFKTEIMCHIFLILIHKRVENYKIQQFVAFEMGHEYCYHDLGKYYSIDP